MIEFPSGNGQNLFKQRVRSLPGNVYKKCLSSWKIIFHELGPAVLDYFELRVQNLQGRIEKVQLP
jgi:hypothetical protein